MLTFAAGSALAVPGLLTALGFAAFAAGIVGHVVLVEEPHLRQQHGPTYDGSRARTGRDLP
jgi:protein-S-isoprenylcysteine O-methyltransferase Ste14